MLLILLMEVFSIFIPRFLQETFMWKEKFQDKLWIIQ